MAKFRTFKSSFVSGELDPTVFGRVETEIYAKAAGRLRNVYVRPSGGAFRREGLEYIATTQGSAVARLVPFEFNDTQTYLLVFTAGQFQVFKTGSNTVQATVTSSPISTITSDMLKEMNWTQSADTLILVHKDLAPISITRTSDTSWTAATISLSNIPDFNFGSGAEDVISATRGWPRSVAFYKGRLVFGGLKSRPQTILMSKVADYFNFSEGTATATDAINITIDDDRVNIIHGIFPGRGLQIFTTGGEFTIRSELNEALTPTTVADQLFKETLHGSGNSRPSVVKRIPRPTSVDGATVFIESSGYVARQFVFNDVEQSFSAPNISILSSHLIRDPVAMDIRRSNSTHPSDYLYVVNGDGTCAVLSNLREQNLLAWSLFETEGTFEDVAVTGREAFFVVKRSINGSDVRYIEKLNPANTMDASKVSTASATTSWTGYAHLNGETVSIRGDDYILEDAAVSGGALTSSEAVAELEAGLSFAAKVTTLPLDMVVEGQRFIGEYKAPVFANVLLYQSRNIIVNYNDKRYVPTFSEFGDNVLDEPISLYDGWKKIYLGGVNRDIEVEITQDDPLEFNVLAVHFAVRI